MVHSIRVVSPACPKLAEKAPTEACGSGPPKRRRGDRAVSLADNDRTASIGVSPRPRLSASVQTGRLLGADLCKPDHEAYPVVRPSNESPPERGFRLSGRRDSNSGPLVPQTSQRGGGGCRRVAASGLATTIRGDRPRSQAIGFRGVWATFGPRTELRLRPAASDEVVASAAHDENKNEQR